MEKWKNSLQDVKPQWSFFSWGFPVPKDPIFWAAKGRETLQLFEMTHEGTWNNLILLRVSLNINLEHLSYV